MSQVRDYVLELSMNKSVQQALDVQSLEQIFRELDQVRYIYAHIYIYIYIHMHVYAVYRYAFIYRYICSLFIEYVKNCVQQALDVQSLEQIFRELDQVSH